ncbi:MAG: hypothetical protein LPK85_12520 [Gammaproteobacteria bacterium]|nr:hypothetical protein [Gammaproteobacteria bacterium]
MVAFAVIGNLSLFAGAEILAATAISGTMVFERWWPAGSPAHQSYARRVCGDGCADLY